MKFSTVVLSALASLVAAEETTYSTSTVYITTYVTDSDCTVCETAKVETSPVTLEAVPTSSGPVTVTPVFHNSSSAAPTGFTIASSSASGNSSNYTTPSITSTYAGQGATMGVGLGLLGAIALNLL